MIQIEGALLSSAPTLYTLASVRDMRMGRFGRIVCMSLFLAPHAVWLLLGLVGLPLCLPMLWGIVGPWMVLSHFVMWLGSKNVIAAPARADRRRAVKAQRKQRKKCLRRSRLNAGKVLHHLSLIFCSSRVSKVSCCIVHTLFYLEIIRRVMEGNELAACTCALLVAGLHCTEQTSCRQLTALTAIALAADRSVEEAVALGVHPAVAY